MAPHIMFSRKRRRRTGRDAAAAAEAEADAPPPSPGGYRSGPVGDRYGRGRLRRREKNAVVDVGALVSGKPAASPPYLSPAASAIEFVADVNVNVVVVVAVPVRVDVHAEAQEIGRSFLPPLPPRLRPGIRRRRIDRMNRSGNEFRIPQLERRMRRGRRGRRIGPAAMPPLVATLPHPTTTTMTPVLY